MNNYTEEVRKIFKQSEIEAINNKDGEVSTKHILLSLFIVNNSLSSILSDYNISYEKVKSFISLGSYDKEFVFYSNELLRIIEDIILKEDCIDEDVTLVMIVKSILENKNSDAYKILNKMDIDIKKLLSDIESKSVTSSNSFIKTLAINLNDLASLNVLDPVIGRDEEVNNLIRILARKNKNNPVLIGEAGVGKTAIVEELARRIVKGNVPSFLKNSIIYNLNIASVIAGTKYRGEFEEKLTRIIQELESNKNFIVFIDEVHTVMGAGGAEGAIDASNILKPALARGNLKLIGATTIMEYKNTIEKDKALDRRFQKVMICEPNNEKLMDILLKVKSNYEDFHNVSVSNEMLKLIAELSNKYIKDRKNPDKSIDILDEVCALESLVKKESKKEKIIKSIDKLKEKRNKYLVTNELNKASLVKKDIVSLEKKLDNLKDNNIKNNVTMDSLRKVLESKLNCPIYELDLDKFKIIINSIKEETRNDNLDKLIRTIESFVLASNNSPILCDINIDNKIINFVSDKLKYHLVNVDMNDFVNNISINKIIGSTAGYVGYNEKNTVFESIKTFPVSFILLENYDKACKEVKDIIESIVSKGYLKLSNGDTIDFNNTLIFRLNSNIKKNSIGFISNRENFEMLV